MDDFYEQCDPDKENLCLYGNPDGTWEVQLPAEEVPPELPEPALGINFARDGMQVRALLFFLTSMQEKKNKSKSDCYFLAEHPRFTGFPTPPTNLFVLAAEGLAGSGGGALGCVVDGGGVLLRREV